MQKRICPICGNIFEATSAGPGRKYCSSSCKSIAMRKRPPIEKHCPACEKTFLTRSYMQVYCSPECAKTSRFGSAQYKKTCPVCGETFTTNFASKIYCSEKCHALHQKKQRTRKCEICGGEFVAGYRYQHFCSNRCRNIARGFKYNTCKLCGKEFPVTKSEYDQKFCSDECAREFSARLGFKKTFRQWCEEADQCGMSYGKYRAAVERLGYTFDELKNREREF